MWVAVLLSHGITTGALFPKFEGGCFVKGTRVSKENVSETLAYMGEYADLPGKLQLHSGRRAGAQYAFFVLKYDEMMMLYHFRWKSAAEMRKYLGLNDTSNRYVRLGFAKAEFQKF